MPHVFIPAASGRTHFAQSRPHRLFSQAEGYLGSTLEPVAGMPFTYRTTDRWRSHADFASFLERFGDAYRALDARYESLSRSETMEFEGLSPDEVGEP